MKKYYSKVLTGLLGLLLLLSFKTMITNHIQTKAQQEKKNIVVYFSGSDWCSVCHKFKKSFLAQSKVDSLLNNHYVYYVADFPQRSKQDKETVTLNETLAEKLNPEGVFPLLVIADADLKIKEKITAKTPVEVAEKHLESHK